MDLFDQVEAYLEATTNVPHLLVLIVSFGLLTVGAYSFTHAFRYAVRERKKNLAVVLLALLATLSLLWGDQLFGALALLALTLYALRKPVERIFRRRKRVHRE